MKKIYPKEFPREEGWRFAKYFGLRAFFNINTNTIVGRTKLEEYLLDFAIWVDVEVLQLESFPISIIPEPEDNIEAED